MRTISLFTILLFVGVFTAQAQEETAAIDSISGTTIASVEPKKSDYQLKLEEKEAKRTVKALKKKNKLDRAILKLESTQRTDEIKLKKMNERHSNTQSDLEEVKREKLELKMAKLEMKMAKDKARLKKLKEKVR